MNERKKLVSIEYLRAFSMLYIVAFWHLMNYTGVFPGYKNLFTSTFTDIVLGLFVLISGFLLASPSKTYVSARQFYTKRLFRIYPLYVLAVALFYFYGLNDATTSFKSLIFISMYYEPAPKTLWFITMLILFYLITPFLLKFVRSPVKFFLITLALLSITLAVEKIFHTVDMRIILYFPSYVAGIYFAYYRQKPYLSNIRLVSFLFALSAILILIDFNSWTLHKLKAMPIILVGSYLMFIISYINEDKFKKLALVSFLSYISYAMYLFHRPIFSTIKTLYFPENEAYQLLYLLSVGLFAIIVISWLLQKLYDISYAKATRR